MASNPNGWVREPQETSNPEDVEDVREDVPEPLRFTQVVTCPDVPDVSVIYCIDRSKPWQSPSSASDFQKMKTSKCMPETRREAFVHDPQVYRPTTGPCNIESPPMWTRNKRKIQMVPERKFVQSRKEFGLSSGEPSSSSEIKQVVGTHPFHGEEPKRHHFRERTDIVTEVFPKTRTSEAPADSGHHRKVKESSKEESAPKLVYEAKGNKLSSKKCDAMIGETSREREITNEVTISMLQEVINRLDVLQTRFDHEISEMRRYKESLHPSHSQSLESTSSSKATQTRHKPGVSKIHKATQTYDIQPPYTGISAGTMTGASLHRIPESEGNRQECVKPKDIGKRVLSKNYQTPDEESLFLDDLEIETVHEPGPSPQASLHLEIPDFRENSEDEADGSGEAATPSRDSVLPSPDSPCGWTLYQNVVSQVNKYLHSEPTKKKEEPNRRPTVESVHYTSVKQIRQLNIYDRSEVKEVSTTRRMKIGTIPQPTGAKSMDSSTDEEDDSSSSVVINAVQSGDDSSSESYTDESNSAVSFYRPQLTNLSAATLEYLERFNLLTPMRVSGEASAPPNSTRRRTERGRRQTRSRERGAVGRIQPRPRDASARPIHMPKVLDITTLKKQPKLL